LDTRWGSGLSGEDRLLLARVEDALRYAGRRYEPKIIGFLDRHIQTAAQSLLAGPAAAGECRALFWGGYEDAERKMLGIFPPYEEPAGEDFPIAALRAEWKFETLTHRDFLGALLGLGFKREKIGDILVSPDACACTVLADRAVADYILANLEKVGRTGVRVVRADLTGIVREDRFATLRDTVASARADCVVSALVSGSRGEAQKLIAEGFVSLDFETVSDPSKKVCDGATVSIRGHGRFLIDRVGPPTRKGRLVLEARKYL
jgi:RNA-binding protein YlmH